MAKTKKTPLLLLVLFLIIIPINQALASKCRNIEGDWEFTSNAAVVSSGTFLFQKNRQIIFRITTQRDCLFFGGGPAVGDPDFFCQATGVIRGKQITMDITCGKVLEKIRGRLITKNKITFTTSTLIVSEEIENHFRQITTGKGIARRVID